MTTQLIPVNPFVCEAVPLDPKRSPLRVKLIPQIIQDVVAGYTQYYGPTFKRKAGYLKANDLKKILENKEYKIVEG